MGDELTLLLEVFYKIEKAGGQVTLSATTVGGKTKLRLEIGTTPASPFESSSTSPRRRHRCRSLRARARRIQRAAEHQAAPAEAATSAPLEDSPLRPPLKLLPSVPADSGGRKVITMEKLDVPTFSSVNMDGSSSPPPRPPRPPTPPSLLRPPLCYNFNCRAHCGGCGRRYFLCVDHNGCYCELDEYDVEPHCLVCNCERNVRHSPGFDTHHQIYPYEHQASLCDSIFSSI